VEGWLLTPESGIIHPAERTAVIADVHLGYEWARGAAGDCVPRHSLDESLDRLRRLLERSPVDRLVVAGDLVESPRPCRRTAAEVACLWRWLDERGIEFVPLRGNHDAGLDRLIHHGVDLLPPALPRFRDRLAVAGWTVLHGHAAPAAGRVILGHHHPAFKASGRSFPCFLVGPDMIVLPAFSGNAAGLDATAAATSLGRPASSFRCLVSTGEEVLDFGPADEVAARLRATNRPDRR
jgi:putative SbcD/Mre11-related phosphoesterase